MINADDMQSWAYLLAPTFQFVNTAGKPLTEGWIEVYIAGTRNKYYCASDFNGTLHPFQIPLDSLGANIVLADPNQAYDVYVYNKYGSLIMSRYHVSPGMTGGSGVLNITITSEDGTVSVTNDGNGNFDLSIQDTVDRIDALEQAVSGLSADSSVGYAIAHAYTVELDGTFDLVNDAVTGIGYTPNMDGFRLKSGHVYQFNFNALFENGAFDRNCSGKLYLEGPNTIAQEWKFDLDDSYYHSQSINGSTVLVTPNDLNYYDVKLKLAWDVDYPNKPNVDLNKISIVDITTLLSTTVSGSSGSYTGGDGIFVNDETNIISVDMDYINSHLNIDASTIIASAVNIATAYTDARVTTVSGDLVNLIAEVSASIPTGTVTQVQSDWTEQDSSSPAYIQHKPDLSVYATHDEVSGVSAVLNERINDVNERINDVSGSIPELPDEEAVEFEEIDLSDYALASAIPDVSDFVTHNEVSAVSGNIIEYVNSVSGDLVETINNVSGDIIHTVETVSGDIIETITTVSGDIINTVETVSAVLEGDIVSAIQVATGAIPELPDEEEVEFEEIDLSDYALASAIPTDYVTHNEVSAVSANLVNYVNSVSGDITNYIDESIVSAINVATGACEQVQSDWTEDDTNDPAYIQNKPNEIEIVAGQNIGIFSDSSTITISASATDLSDYATNSEVSAVSASIVNQIPDISGLATRTEVNNVSGVLETEIQIVSAAIGEQVPNVSIQSPSGTLVVTETVSGNNKIYSIDVAPTTGIEYGQFYATNITGAATMSRTKGNIDITNDGKIKLKQGQSYHITVRGRYNQTTLKDNYTVASYIEYVTNNSININVDESRSDSQYFELSYDLFKLNSDTDYYVFFTLDDATVNDLFIDIHSLANVGSNGSSGGSSPEYDAGYGIQILNNVISVSGIAPQVQSDWNQTNTSSVDYIKNKPEEYGLIAGDNISITASGNNFIISSTASAASGVNYQAGYGIDITGDTISVDASIIPSTSAYATHTEVNNVSAAIIAQIPEQQVNSDWTATSGVAEILNKPNESELIAGDGVSITASGSNYIISAVVTGTPIISGYVTEAELETVSGNIVNQIPDVSNLATKTEVQAVETNVQIVSAAIPTLPTEEEVEFEELDLSDYALASAIPDVSNLATKSELQTVSAAIPDVSNFVTETELETVSGNIVNQIPDVSNFVTGPTVSAIVDEALVDVPSGVSGVVAGDGISITASGSNYVISCNVTGGGDVTRADLAAVSGTLESQIQIVSASIPDTSNLATKSEVSTASGTLNTKIETVSASIPTLPSEEEVVFEELDLSDYALASAIPDISNLASKSEVNAVSGTLQTEIVAISGAMVDVPTGVSGVVAGQGIAITASGSDYVISCTVTGGDTTYTAGDYIGIVDDTISVTGITDLVAGDNITITASGNSAIISGQAGGGEDNNVFIAEYGVTTSSEIQTALNAGKEIICKCTFNSLSSPDIGTVYLNTIKNYNVGSFPNETIRFGGVVYDMVYNPGTQSYGSYKWLEITFSTYTSWSYTTYAYDPLQVQANWNETSSSSKAYIQNKPDLSSFVTSTTVSAIVDTALVDVPSGVSGLVGGTNVSITASGSNYVIDATVPDVSNLATKTEVANVEADVQIVSASIPTLPTEEEIEFAEVDLSDYALASAIPVVTGFATEVELRTVSAAIPDVSNLATKTEVTTGLGTKQNTLTGITDVQVVQSLPVSPVSSVLYLIPEV